MALSFIFAATAFILDSFFLWRFSDCMHQRGGSSEFLIQSEAVLTKVTRINMPCDF